MDVASFESMKKISEQIIHDLKHIENIVKIYHR